MVKKNSQSIINWEKKTLKLYKKRYSWINTYVWEAYIKNFKNIYVYTKSYV